MTVVCITGMHRSGTSMIARLLNLCGLYLGPDSDISLTAEDNPEGFWENVHFLRLDDEILSELGGAWDKLPELPPGWQDRPNLLWCRTNAARLVEQFSPHGFWGWKDPRASLTIDLWRSLLPDLKVVICLRNPLDVVRSLARRGYSSRAFGFDLWFAHNQHLLASVPAQNRIITHYGAYFEDPAAELARLLEFLGVVPSPEQLNEALASIKVPLRHHDATFQDLLDQKPKLEVIKLYADMCLQTGPLAGPLVGTGNAAFDLTADEYSKYLERREKELLLQRIQDADARADEQERSVQALRAEVDALSEELRQYHALSQTAAWRLARSFDRLVNVVAPQGSLASRFWARTVGIWALSPALAVIESSDLFDPDWYLEHNPDVAAAAQDPAVHYLRSGGFEGRDPGPSFSSSWYLQQYPDVSLAGMNPLVHYLKHGQAMGRLPCPPGRAEAPPGVSARAHVSAIEPDDAGMLPSSSAADAAESEPSDTTEPQPSLPAKGMRYLRTYGLVSFLTRAQEKLREAVGKWSVRRNPRVFMAAYRSILQVARPEMESMDYVPLAQQEISAAAAPVKLLAFYLPQFHPIPENDRWWGRGFTEWTNVSKAVPQFIGHYQPRLPGELGFYDLRVPEVQQRQLELARQYGIYGFAFHYYWFNGRRLLERPLDNFLANRAIDFPFCICWANENWTRRWDGQENELLIAQQHSPESDVSFIRDIIPIFEDRRYIRVNDRPVLVVYRANILPDARQTVGLWRDYCERHGYGNPYLIAAQTFGFEDPRTVGFDAAVEFPPHTTLPLKYINPALQILNPNYQGNVFSYPDFVDQASIDRNPPYKLYKTVFPGWDNEARKPGRATATFIGSTPTEYRRWLVNACRTTLMKEPDPDKRLVFINAWNEWGEGAYLEPDRRYGYAYLQATALALQDLCQPAAEPDVTLPSEDRPDPPAGHDTTDSISRGAQ